MGGGSLCVIVMCGMCGMCVRVRVRGGDSYFAVDWVGVEVVLDSVVHNYKRFQFQFQIGLDCNSVVPQMMLKIRRTAD